ncbi:MAG TPA: pitrilysin family protein [Bacteroidales bacterium]|nr:pitrilysin family protein [Bacteroidales bacterium]HPS27273.1 pitrilysin family protein [Bacteroidales bacterium]
MKNEKELNFFKLDNGIRIVHKTSDTPIVHLGIFINAGSRDETLAQQGLAHFIEHVFFKGTETRRSSQIYNSIENYGGELNAYTAKEETCIHCSVLIEYFEKAAEVISDVLFHSTFPEKELAKEKAIILDEYYYYKDIPEEVILDDFDELVFKNHPLGWNILGEPSKIKGFTKNDIKTFMDDNYHPEEMVISIIGGLDSQILLRVLKKCFEQGQSSGGTITKRNAFKGYKPVRRHLVKNIFQSHCVMGRPAYTVYDKRRLGLVLLNNLLGGPASNARLNMAVREKHGLSYNIESSYSAFSDTGLFRIYVSTENGSMDKTIELIYGELSKLRQQKLGAVQLAQAKRQLIGNIALANESKIAEMLALGKTYLVFDKIDSIAQINHKIEQIKDTELLEIANEIFDTKSFAQIIYQSNESYRSEDN